MVASGFVWQSWEMKRQVVVPSPRSWLLLLSINAYPNVNIPEYSLAIIVSILFSKNFTFWRESSSPSSLVRLGWFSLGIADQNRRPRFAYFHPSEGTSQDSPVDCFEKDLDSASAMLNEFITSVHLGPMTTVHSYSDLISFRLFRIPFLTMKSEAGRGSVFFLTEWPGDLSWAELSEGCTRSPTYSPENYRPTSESGMYILICK